jgi:hypothetical protein
MEHNTARGTGLSQNALTSSLGQIAAAVGHAVRNALPIAADVIVEHARQHAGSYLQTLKDKGLKGVYQEVKANVPKVAADIVRKAVAGNGSIGESLPPNILLGSAGWPLVMHGAPFIASGPFMASGPFLGGGPFIAGGPFLGGADIPTSIGLNVEAQMAKHMPLLSKYVGHLPFLAHFLDDLSHKLDMDIPTQQRMVQTFFQMRQLGRLSAASDLFAESIHHQVEAFLATIEHIFLEVLTVLDAEDHVQSIHAGRSLEGGSILGTIGSILSPLAGLILGPAAGSLISSLGSAFGTGNLLGSHGHGMRRAIANGGPYLLRGATVDGSGLVRHMRHIQAMLRHNLKPHHIANLLLPGIGKPLATHPSHKTFTGINVHRVHDFLVQPSQDKRKKRRHGR